MSDAPEGRRRTTRRSISQVSQRFAPYFVSPSNS